MRFVVPDDGDDRRSVAIRYCGDGYDQSVRDGWKPHADLACEPRPQIASLVGNGGESLHIAGLQVSLLAETADGALEQVARQGRGTNVHRCAGMYTGQMRGRYLDAGEECRQIGKRADFRERFNRHSLPRGQLGHHAVNGARQAVKLNSEFRCRQVCLNASQLGLGFGDFLRSLMPWTTAFHLADNAGDRDSHLAPGRGNVPWGALFRAAAEAGFSGSMCIETPPFAAGPDYSMEAWIGLREDMDLLVQRAFRGPVGGSTPEGGTAGGSRGGAT